MRGLSAALVVLSLAACTSNSTTPTPTTSFAPASTLTSKMIGVGDSLTAGMQSNALLGANISPNPLGALSPFPFVPNTQGNGYWEIGRASCRERV